MASVADTAEKSMTISRSAADDRFHRALLIFVGKGKRHPVAEVSKGTGICSSVIYGWLAGPDSESWRKLHPAHLLTMAGYLGPDFTCEVLEPVSQGAFWLPDADDTPPGELAADLSEDTAHVVRAAINNDFDKDERRNLRPVGARMMARGAQIYKMGAVA